MKNSRFKEIILNVSIFAALLAFSLWKGRNFQPILPSLAFLLLANLMLELSRDLKRSFQLPIYIISLIFYPISYDFLRYSLLSSFLGGLSQLLLYLFFIRLVLSYQSSFLFHKRKGIQVHLLRLLLSLDFGFIMSLLKLDLTPLTQIVNNFSLSYGKNLFHSFSIEKALFFTFVHILFFYGLNILLPDFEAKK